MKALSVRQPWATYIATGEKTVECRTWFTRYRGDLLICSSKASDLADSTVCPLGAAVCVVELLDVHPFREEDLLGAQLLTPANSPDRKGDWADPDEIDYVMQGYAWILGSPRPIRPFPVRGKLNLYEVDRRPEILDKRHFGLSYWDYLMDARMTGRW